MGKEKEMSFHAVIFDLDGTLLDTLEDITNAANRVLDKAGFPTHSLEEYRYLVGQGSEALLEHALPRANRDKATIKACLDAFLEDYSHNWKVKTRLYDGIPFLLDSLSDRGLKMAILSNKRHEFTRMCATEFLHRWRFEAVLGQREGFPPKPDPAGALQIGKVLEIAPPEILYLGDTSVDMQTALRAGMTPVGALWGFRTLEELLENGAKAVLKEPFELLTLLDSPASRG
jgi:phosphoglycolate phosphatase